MPEMRNADAACGLQAVNVSSEGGRSDLPLQHLHSRRNTNSGEGLCRANLVFSTSHPTWYSRRNNSLEDRAIGTNVPANGNGSRNLRNDCLVANGLKFLSRCHARRDCGAQSKQSD